MLAGGHTRLFAPHESSDAFIARQMFANDRNRTEHALQESEDQSRRLREQNDELVRAQQRVDEQFKGLQPGNIASGGMARGSDTAPAMLYHASHCDLQRGFRMMNSLLNPGP